jgi:hypothetical protein
MPMILLIEPNKRIRKRLCDLLSRERIIGIESYPQILEMLCKFKENFNLLIANIRLLKEIISKGTIFKLCEKLYIKVPPILAVYRKGDEKLKKEFEQNYKQYKLVKYDADDTSFPEQYIQALRELYPDVITDVKKATENWLKADEPVMSVDHRKWLIDEGFLETIDSTKIGKLTKDIEEIVPLIKKMLSTEQIVEKEIDDIKKEVDYKEKYFELKKKYDELLKYLKDLSDLT